MSEALSVNRERVAMHCVCCGGTQLGTSGAILMPFIAHRVFGWTPLEIDESWGLKTIRHGSAYSVCNSLFCKDCGLLFLDIRFSDAELGRLYGDYRGEAYTQLRESYEPGYAQRNQHLNAGVGYLDEIEKFLAPHVRFPLSVLDWGGDTGKNTPFQKQAAAWDIYDISDKPVLAGARRVNKDEAFAKRYGLIVCSNVLEHIPYPADILLDIREAMDESSVLYVEVPYEDVMRLHAAEPFRHKRHWHEHINFFSENALRQLMARVGLKILAMNKLEASAGGNSSSLFQVACALETSNR